MTNNKVNLFISSKNKKYDEENNKISITVPDGLLTVREDEYFVMKVMKFYSFNTMYNINSKNNWFRVDNVNYYLPLGSPNVNELKDNLNTQLTSINLVISYDKITNKYRFTNNTGTNKSIVIINSGLFLGLDNNTTYTINANSYLSSINPICMIDNNSINISITGDIELKENNIDYVRNNSIQTNNLVFQKLIDVSKNCVLFYENKGDDVYSYILNNIDSINYLTINVLDQNLNYIEDMSDYYLTISFEKITKENTNSILLKIKEYLNDILLILFNLGNKYQII